MRFSTSNLLLNQAQKQNLAVTRHRADVRKSEQGYLSPAAQVCALPRSPTSPPFSSSCCPCCSLLPSLLPPSLFYQPLYSVVAAVRKQPVSPLFSPDAIPASPLTFHHHECRGLRDCVLLRFTAQHLRHHLRAAVWKPPGAWRLIVGRDVQDAASPAAGQDETGGEVHTSATERLFLALRHVR